MVKVKRITPNFEPYISFMDIETLKGMYNSPLEYSVIKAIKKLGFVIFICDRAEGIIKIIAKDNFTNKKDTKKQELEAEINRKNAIISKLETQKG